MLESDMRKQIIKRWKDLIRVTRIESPGTRSIPDLQIRSFSLDWWVELKHFDNRNPTLYTIAIPWRAGQINWLSHHNSFNGNICLLVTIQDRWYVIQNRWNILREYINLSHLEECSDYYGYIWNLPDSLWEK